MRIWLLATRVYRLIQEEKSRLIEQYPELENIGVDIEVKLVFKMGEVNVFIDRYARKIIFECPFFLLFSRSLRAMIRYILLKWISYMDFCPKSPENIRDMLIKTRNIDSEYILLASFLLIEILSEYYVLHLDYDLALQLYKKFRTGIMTIKRSPWLTCVMKNIYNLMIGEEIFNDEDNKCKSISNEIFKVIFSKNFSSQAIWSIIVEELAKLLLGHFRYDLHEFEEIINVTDLSLPSFITALAHGISYPSFVRKMIQYYREGGMPVLLKFLPMPDKEILRLWYRERARELVRVKIQTKVFYKKTRMNYPTTWSLGDPIEDLDPFLSINISPVLIPNYTTKKWNSANSAPIRSRIIVPNVLLVIDSSMSMGRLLGDVVNDVVPTVGSSKLKYAFGSKFDIAVLVAFGIIDLVINLGGKVAAINFSGKAIAKGFTNNKTDIEDVVMIHQNDGTIFPSKLLEKIVGKRRGVLIIIISDAAIYNQRSVLRCLEKLSKDNDVYFIHVDIEKKTLKQFLSSISQSARIIRISNLSRLPKVVLNLVSKHMIKIGSFEV